MNPRNLLAVLLAFFCRHTVAKVFFNGKVIDSSDVPQPKATTITITSTGSTLTTSVDPLGVSAKQVDSQAWIGPPVNEQAKYEKAVAEMVALIQQNQQFKARSPNSDYPLPESFDNRNQIVEWWAKANFTHGAEVGVLWGANAEFILNTIPGLQRLYLIDIWEQQANYIDFANANNVEQSKRREAALNLMRRFPDKVIVQKGLSTNGAASIPLYWLDFAYIDARHDFCGVFEDLVAFYPLLKCGGVLAGHDYYWNSEVQKHTPNQDWSVCHSGEKQDGAVRGAVDFFVRTLNGLRKGRPPLVIYQSREVWPSWYLRKVC